MYSITRKRFIQRFNDRCFGISFMDGRTKENIVANTVFLFLGFARPTHLD